MMLCSGAECNHAARGVERVQRARPARADRPEGGRPYRKGRTNKYHSKRPAGGTIGRALPTVSIACEWRIEHARDMPVCFYWHRPCGESRRRLDNVASIATVMPIFVYRHSGCRERASQVRHLDTPQKKPPPNVGDFHHLCKKFPPSKRKISSIIPL